MFVCESVQLYLHERVYIGMCGCVCVHCYVCVCVCVHWYVCVCVGGCFLYIGVCLCTLVYVGVCVFASVYLCLHVFKICMQLDVVASAQCVWVSVRL